MAKDISAMSADLQTAMEQHAKDSLVAVRATADQMASRVASLSSPLYGVSVQTRTVDTLNGKQVLVRIESTDGPGKVFGGQAAVKTAAAQAVESVAKEGGLDRRR